MIARKTYLNVARTQETDTRCFDTRENHGHCAKRKGAKKLRQWLRKLLRREDSEPVHLQIL